MTRIAVRVLLTRWRINGRRAMSDPIFILCKLGALFRKQYALSCRRQMQLWRHFSLDLCKLLLTPPCTARRAKQTSACACYLGGYCGVCTRWRRYDRGGSCATAIKLSQTLRRHQYLAPTARLTAEGKTTAARGTIFYLCRLNDVCSGN